jgi:outer membrane protein assembly factor BamA
VVGGSRASAGWINFVLDIQEGPRGVVTELIFDGTHGLAGPILIKTVTVKPNRSWWAKRTGNDVFYPKKLLTDHPLLEYAYRTAKFCADRAAFRHYIPRVQPNFHVHGSQITD